MKKHLSFIMLFLAFGIQAQTQISTSKTQIAQAMALFVENVKPAYQNGQTYKEFEKKLIGTWNNTPEGTALLSKAFEYLSKGVSSNRIAKDYDGIEFTNALAITANSKYTNADGMEVFGGAALTDTSFCDKGTKGSCKWYQITCYIEKVSLN